MKNVIIAIYYCHEDTKTLSLHEGKNNVYKLLCVPS